MVLPLASNVRLLVPTCVTSFSLLLVRLTGVPSVVTLEKFARALEVPMYVLFYEGEEPPKPPNLPKRKSVGDVGWGSSGKDARMLSKFRRLLGRTEGANRRLLLFMAQKMARRKAV